jgi:hypothetical protein
MIIPSFLSSWAMLNKRRQVGQFMRHDDFIPNRVGGDAVGRTETHP